MSKDFGQDEILPGKSLNNFIKEPFKTEQINKEENKVELNPNKYLKFFELNEEGLKLYGQYKKTQWLNVLKWSFLGTAVGVSLGLIVEFNFKKMNPGKKDVIKTMILFGSIGLLSIQGYYVATHEFQKKQNELVELYGKEVK